MDKQNAPITTEQSSSAPHSISLPADLGDVRILKDNESFDINAPITAEKAAEALDSLDDYARMDIGVDAMGPRGVLERYIKQQAAVSQPAEIKDTDAAREFLVGWHLEHMNDHPFFTGYIRETLAGDFAFQLARALSVVPVVAVSPDVPELIERIAQQWDGCIYSAPGDDIDIGEAIRRAAIDLAIEQEKKGGAV